MFSVLAAICKRKMFLTWLAGIIFLGYIRGGNRLAFVCSNFSPGRRIDFLFPGAVHLNVDAHVAQLELLLPPVFMETSYLVLSTVSSPLSTP